MDLLGDNPEFDVSDKSWKIHSRNPLAPPECIGENGVVKNSMIADGCIIEGEVENSIIFRNVKVARGTVVKNSIIMQNTVLGEHSMLNCIIADKNVVIKDKKVLSGSDNHPFYIGKGIMI